MIELFKHSNTSQYNPTQNIIIKYIVNMLIGEIFGRIYMFNEVFS